MTVHGKLSNQYGRPRVPTLGRLFFARQIDQLSRPSRGQRFNCLVVTGSSYRCRKVVQPARSGYAPIARLPQRQRWQWQSRRKVQFYTMSQIELPWQCPRIAHPCESIVHAIGKIPRPGASIRGSQVNLQGRERVLGQFAIMDALGLCRAIAVRPRRMARWLRAFVVEDKDYAGTLTRVASAHVARATIQ